MFSHSKLAINAATSTRLPITNAVVTFALREIYAQLITKLVLSLLWIPGHAGIGGNERVDKLSKGFAHGAADLPTLSVAFSSTVTRAPWPFVPLIGVPIKYFLADLRVSNSQR